MTCPRPLLLAGLCVSFVAACADEPARKNIDDFLTYRPLTERVDPLIGSRGPGNVVPGALVPHGAVKLSPDTLGPNGTIDAYEHADEKIEGFSHTHLEGPGGSFSGYSQLLVMATRGEIAPDEAGYASRYSHDTEEASPGYYAVDLTDANVRAELTATHAAASTATPSAARVPATSCSTSPTRAAAGWGAASRSSATT